jgi:hypothetical protein
MLDKAVSKRGFAVIDMSYNAEVSYLFHNAVLFTLIVKIGK